MPPQSQTRADLNIRMPLFNVDAQGCAEVAALREDILKRFAEAIVATMCGSPDMRPIARRSNAMARR